MRPKIFVAAGVIVAFLTGLMASGIYNASTRAFNASTDRALDPDPLPAPAVHRTHLVQPKTVYVSQPVAVSAPAVKASTKRSWERETLIVGGSAGAGAAIGAIAGGKKGAGVGALSGGVAGLVYDLATRNK